MIGLPAGTRIWLAAGVTDMRAGMNGEFFNGDALESACMAGYGLAQLPTWLAGDALRRGALVEVLSDITGGAMPIHVVWQKTWHLQPKVRVTVDELLRMAADAPHAFNRSKI